MKRKTKAKVARGFGRIVLAIGVLLFFGATGNQGEIREILLVAVGGISLAILGYLFFYRHLGGGNPVFDFEK